MVGRHGFVACRKKVEPSGSWWWSGSGEGSYGGGKWLSIVGDDVDKVLKEREVGKGLETVGGYDFVACRQKVETARGWWWKRNGGGAYGRGKWHSIVGDDVGKVPQEGEVGKGVICGYGTGF